MPHRFSSRVLLGFALLAFGCGDGGNELVVDLVTDLVPGIELDRVRTELLTGEPSVGSGASVQVNEVDASGATGLSMGGGRVAEFRGLAADQYLIRVQAILGGSIIAERTVRLDVRSQTGVTVVISRDCRGVMCPQAGDSPAAISCIGGSCALPECVTGAEAECAPPQCTTAADCPAAAGTCGTASCVESLCIIAVDDSVCAEGERCHPTLGCVGGDECLPLPEICNGLDDDCDEAIDEAFDLNSDRDHCGACGAVCDAANADATCVLGACEVTCDPGYADCNGDTGDGCEASLASSSTCGDCGTSCAAPAPLCATGPDGGFTCESDCGAGTSLCGGSCADTTSDLAHCGACDATCAPANADAECSAGACGVASCDAGFGDCTGGEADGCETRLNSNSDCGGCGLSCALGRASATCATGTCRISSCNAGWGDCDGNDANGCETQLNTLTHCGGCGISCSRSHASATCTTGTCQIGSCDAGWSNCDGSSGNGCETQLNTLTHCGGCGVPCSRNHASASCSTGSCQLGSCNAGWGNCDGNDTNGCETQLNALANCGGCGVPCSGLPRATGESCASGSCQPTGCTVWWDDCDGNGANGCETNVRYNDLHCGECGLDCIGGASCSNGECLGGS